MTRARAHTLIELAVSVTVLSVIAAATLPITNGVADTYASATSTRSATEDAWYAMDRVLRMLRETPENTGTGLPDITRADTDAVGFGDGRLVELVGTNLEITSDTGITGVLCRDVDAFSISYLGDDGVLDTASTPELTRRFMVTITAGGLELRSAAFVRIAMVSP